MKFTRKGFVSPVVLILVVLVVLYLNGWDVRALVQSIADLVVSVVEWIAAFFR